MSLPHVFCIILPHWLNLPRPYFHFGICQQRLQHLDHEFKAANSHDHPTAHLHQQSVMSVHEIFGQAQYRTSQSLIGRLRHLEAKPRFENDLKDCVSRMLNIRIKEPVGDRLVRFLVSYLQSSSEYVTSILSALLPYLSAKDKTVRFRATQIVAQAINSLDAIDDELYHDIRQILMKRIRDKIPGVRIQAVIGLGRLAENEMDDNQDEDENSEYDSEVEKQSLLEKLLDILQNDTNAEVRRILLQNLPLTPTTLPYILERARDRDALTRRAVYTKLLPTLGDFRHLSLSMREKLLRWGLRDRDETVRKATGRLFRERWIEDCAGPRVEGDQKGAKSLAPPSMPGLLELLERIDVVNSGTESGIALEAMKDFWAGRPDYVDSVEFDDDFWLNLTSESAFMARTFNDYCQENPEYEQMCEEKMPEVTRLGFYLQKYTNNLLETIRSSAELGGGEEEIVEGEFIVEQLLHIAKTLDYTDEVGRRKMFSLLRDALAMADLPEEVTRLTVEVLRLVCGTDIAGEKDFCGVVLEAVAEVHDTINVSDAEKEDDSFVSARSEVSVSSGGTASAKEPTEDDEQKALHEVVVNMKCLHIAQCMLQNVDCSDLQSNLHLVSTLNNLVIPAVRSHEAPIRERGIMCLGLYCLLDKSLALNNLMLFRACFEKGKRHDALRVTVLQILTDIVVKHGVDVDLGVFGEAINAGPEVQKASTISLSKLLLSRLYSPKELAPVEDELELTFEQRLDDVVERAINSEAIGADTLHKVKLAVEKATEEKQKEREKEAELLARESPEV
jgi:condensin complex subunit 3